MLPDMLPHERQVDLQAKLSRAKSPFTSPAELEQLSADYSLSVALHARRNPSMPLHVLERLVTKQISWRGGPDNTDPTLDAILHNPATPGELLRAVFDRATGGFTYQEPLLLVGAILLHPNCPARELAWGVESRRENYRAAAAENPSLTPEQAAVLAGDHALLVLQALLRNKALPSAALAPILKNPNTNRPIRFALVERFDDEYRQQAITYLLELPGDVSPTTRDLVATFTTDPARITAACSDPDVGVRECAAANPLATDEDKVTVALQRRSGFPLNS